MAIRAVEVEVRPCQDSAPTHDLSSYSLGNIALVNIGNAVHSVYVVHLPSGPIWFQHLFYVTESPWN